MNNKQTTKRRVINKNNYVKARRFKERNDLTTGITPLKLYRRFHFIDENYIKSNSGAQYIVYDFKINDLWDPDPLILSGSITGIAEHGAFYEFYRVKETTFKLTITNEEDFPVKFGVVFGALPLVGVISTKTSAASFLENGNTIKFANSVLSAKGGQDRSTGKATIHPGQVLGNVKEYESDISYQSNIGASPGTAIYGTFIAYSMTSSNLTNGVATDLHIVMDADLYGRKVLST